MKVLFVTPSYEPAWAFGGTVTATVNLCRTLAKKGIDVTIYTTNADGKGGYLDVPLNGPVNLGGVKVWYFHCDLMPRKAFYSESLENKLRKTVKDYDLVHVSAIWQWMQVNVYNECKKARIPYIVSPNGSFRKHPWSRKAINKTLYWYFFSKKTVKNADAIHFTTEEERKDSFSTIPFVKKIPNFIVPNGIKMDIKKKNINIREMLNISPNTFLILFLGRIHKIKGIDLILKSLSLIKDLNFHFLVVGPKEDKEYYCYLKWLSKKLGLNKKVTWFGPVENDEIWDFYSSANLYIQMSYSENFAMTVVEAMACGLPVLINNNIGIWEEILENKAGFVVNQNTNEIAKTLRELIQNSKILKLFSQNAKRLAKERFNINKVADLMIKAYEDILTGRRSPELQWM